MNSDTVIQTLEGANHSFEQRIAQLEADCADFENQHRAMQEEVGQANQQIKDFQDLNGEL